MTVPTIAMRWGVFTKPGMSGISLALLHLSGGILLKNPVLWATAGAVLLFQVWYISRGWKEVGIGNLDFASLYKGAASARRGNAPAYDASKLTSGNEGTPTWNPRAIEPSVDSDNLHPPFEVLVFFPLTFLRYSTACIVWCICNMLFLALVPVALWKQIPNLHAETHIVLVVLGFTRQVTFSLAYGQDSILLLLLLSLSLASLAEHRDLRAGVFLALGLFKFHLVLPIIAVLLVMRNWRAIVGFFAGASALLLAACAVMGTRALGYFPYIFHYTRHISVNAQDQTAIMPNLRGLVAAIAPNADPKTQSITVALVSLALIVLLFAWILKFQDVPIAIRFSLVIAITSLISYHYFPHNSVILLIPALLIANYFHSSDTSQKLRWAFTAVAIGFCLASFGFAPVRIAMPFLAIDTIALAAVIFAIPYTTRAAVPAVSRSSVIEQRVPSASL